MSDAPVELIALDEPYEGVISARRQDDPVFSHVQGVADAIMAAFAGVVDLLVPADGARDVVHSRPSLL